MKCRAVKKIHENDMTVELKYYNTGIRNGGHKIKIEDLAQFNIIENINAIKNKKANLYVYKLCEGEKWKHFVYVTDEWRKDICCVCQKRVGSNSEEEYVILKSLHKQKPEFKSFYFHLGKCIEEFGGFIEYIWNEYANYLTKNIF